MPLTTGEKDQVRENRFHLDLLDMVLVRRGDQSDVYRGPGFIRQSAEGMMEYRIYDRVRESSLELLDLSVGDSIPDERFYDLEAHDIRGRTWRASRAFPSTDSAVGVNGCICKGTVRQITCVEEAPESSPTDGLWMYLPGEFKLPTSAGTRVTREALENRSYSFDLNLWQVDNPRFEFLFTKVDNGLEVEASPAGGAFPEYFDMRLEESLWFALAIPAKWSLLEEVKGGEHRFTIRALRVVGEVIEALTDIPVPWLMSGEETSGDVGGSMYSHVNSGRLIENAQNALAQAEPHDVLERLTELEKRLDRLGPACHDHRANAISNLTYDTLKLIDAADPFRLNSLVSRFIDAAELTRSEDFFTPSPDHWSFFLFESFRATSYTGTKFLCLEGLVKYFVKFGSGWNKKYVWLVAQEIEDPNLMDQLTQCLREEGAGDIAELLDGVPEDRPLDAEALKIMLLAWRKLG